MMNCSCGGKCLTCKIVGTIIAILGAVLALASLYAVYRVHIGTANAFGSTNGSLSIIAAVFALGLAKKGMKMCPCRSKGCGCGAAGCNCGDGCSCGKENCNCGSDHGHDHKMEMPK